MGGPEILINEAALVSNLRHLQSMAAQQKLFPVIKADAYGHGAPLIAQALDRHFPLAEIPYICLARLTEAYDLRVKSKSQRPILILSQFAETDFDQLQAIGEKSISLVINRMADVQSLESLRVEARACLQGVHINFNTGMNRLGFSIENLEVMEGVFVRLHNMGLPITGLMTHLARAEEDSALLSQSQVQRFTTVVETLKNKWKLGLWGAFPQWIHFSNSAGLTQQYNQQLNLGQLQTSAARPGLLLWGISPFAEEQKKIQVKPVLELRAPVRQLFWVNQGQGIGYGHRYHCTRKTLIGTVALGYADGISRKLSRSQADQFKTGFVIEGIRVPIVGTVSMDMTMVDLTAHPMADRLYQEQGRDLWAYWICAEQTVSELASELQSIPYEILCRLNHRIPRKWKETGLKQQ